MNEEGKLVRIGRRNGVAGTSAVWEVLEHGRWRPTRRDVLKARLLRGDLSGIESVRRADGDWGPLFGRPMYREVFEGTDEPRDHAKARARASIERLRLRERLALGVTVVALLLGFPGLWWGAPGALLVGTAAGVLTGMIRLRRTMSQRALDQLVDALVPPVLEPPPIVDWEALAEADRTAIDGSSHQA